MNRSPNKLIVLYISSDSTLGGSVLSLYDIISSVYDFVYPIVLFPEGGVGYEYFVGKGVECYVHPFVKLYSFKANRLIDVWRHPWKWHHIKKIRTDYGCALYVKRKLKGREVDIVHTNTSPNNVGVYLSRLLKAKHVWHVRECLDAHAQFSMYGGMPRLIRQINHADARIAISSYVKNHWKMVDRNTFLIFDGVCHKDDVVFSSYKERFVLFVSYYISEVKGARKAVKSFGLSRLAEESFKLVFLGNCDIEYRFSLMDTAREYHCEDSIVFVPSQTDVKPFFEKASALIMASENEGLGRVTAEAMFYGCPVVAHASGGTMDIVDNGITGYLFTSIAECSDLLREVCLSDQRQIAMRAQEFAINNLSSDSCGKKVLEVYDAVLY